MSSPEQRRQVHHHTAGGHDARRRRGDEVPQWDELCAQGTPRLYFSAFLLSLWSFKHFTTVTSIQKGLNFYFHIHFITLPTFLNSFKINNAVCYLDMLSAMIAWNRTFTRVEGKRVRGVLRMRWSQDIWKIGHNCHWGWTMCTRQRCFQTSCQRRYAPESICPLHDKS